MTNNDLTNASSVWTNDLLNRKEDASYLTQYLANRYESKNAKDAGFVLAVNADWGFGKTFLLKNWAHDLQRMDHPAIYFDAWESDFTPEPLVAFISKMEKELAPLFKKVPIAKRIFKDAIQNVGKLWKPVAIAVSKSLLKQGIKISIDEIEAYLANEEEDDLTSDLTTSTEDIREKVIEAASKAIKTTLKEHRNKELSIAAFKLKLSQLIDEIASAKDVKLPIFFFIDELDRCRPDYAIELLEGIKHLFGVKGIYFIIGTNIPQLSHSVKAIYGNGFDGDGYLKRFFDLEYALPEPDTTRFSQSLFANAVLPTDKRYLSSLPVEFYGGGDQMPTVFDLYATAFNLPLRDRIRVMSIIEAAVSSISESTVHVHYLFGLAMLYHKVPVEFEMVRLGQKKLTDVLKSTMTRQVQITHHSRSMSPYESATKSETSLRDVFSAYADYAQKDLKVIVQEGLSGGFINQMLQQLTAELSGGYNPSQTYVPSIARYPALVRQAGNFR